MVSDGDVFVAQALTGKDHLIDRVPAVAPRAMHVKIAANIRCADERRKITTLRRGNLVPSLAQLGWNPGKAELLVETLFGVGDHGLTFAVEQAAAVERQPHPMRTLSELSG